MRPDSFTLAHHWEVNENAEIRSNLHTTLPSKRPDRSGFMGGVHAGVRLSRTARAQMSAEAYYKTIFSAGPMPADFGATLSVLF